MFKQVHFVLSALILMGILVTACMSPASPVPQVTKAPTTAPTPALTTVKVAYLPTSSFGPIYIAQDEGYFARQGITVELVKFQSGSMALPLLLDGSIAVVGGPISPAYINAIAKGGHIQIVADKGSITPGACTANALMVRKTLYDDGTVRSVADLKGRKISGVTGDNTYTMSRVLAMGNLTLADIQTADMDYASSVVAFDNGAIDAAMLTEPYITQAIKRGSAVILLKGEDYLPGYTLPLYYGPAILDKDPELGNRFMIAYLQGVKQYNEGKTERNLAIVSNYTKLDRDLLNESCWYPITADGSVSRQVNTEYMDWMLANKKITQTVTDEQLYNTSYVTYANGVLQNTSGSR
jgi:NitT/TauT family transport system substrate-binding protein